MVRHVGRHALVVACIAALLAAALPLCFVTPAEAQAGSRMQALSRVQRILDRRRVLADQLARLRPQLAQKRAQASALRVQLEAPANSMLNAPQVRAKLLDQAADAERVVASVTSRIIAAASEDVALEEELQQIVAAAQGEALSANKDTSAQGALAARNARQHLATLRTRSKALAPRVAAEQRARNQEVIAQLRAQKADAEQLAGRYDAELRYASVSPTVPGNKPQAAPLKTCKMHEIDWKNVTITVGGQTTKLRDGSGPIEPWPGGMRARLQLKQVDFLDSNLDGRQEALLLTEREQLSSAEGKRIVDKSDVLYVFEAALDCSMRRRAALTLSSRGGGQGKAVRGGYAYTAGDGSVAEYGWNGGRLEARRGLGDVAATERASR